MQVGANMSLLKFRRLIKPQLPHTVKVFTDGAIRPDQKASGLSVVVYDLADNLLEWQSWKVDPLTCNEAEYQAVIAALDHLFPLGPDEVDVYTDSQILVNQISGAATAQAPRLRQALVRLRGIVSKYKRVTFHHIPREHNRLADALANEVVDKKVHKRWMNGKD